MSRLANKVIVITGSTGIAAATADLAVAEGASLFITGLIAEDCEALAEKTGCAWRAGDLLEGGAADEVVKRCLERYGRVDALYNVAGISGRRFGDGPIHECSEAGWDATLDTNVKTMFLMCRAALRQMLRQAPGSNGLRGTILNMGSVSAFSPERRFFATHAYAASKGAVVALSKAMAAYYGPHKIRVNVIAPGLVRTPMSRRAQQDPAILEFMETKQPLAGGMIGPEEIARASVFLLSDESRAVTGEVFTVDAGWRVSG